jgi:hypothetical protein
VLEEMRHIYSKSLWSDTVILAWLTAWLIAVPLIHIHPETAHSHGGFDHVHKGITHTLFSADCPDELGASPVPVIDSLGASEGHFSAFGPAAHIFLEGDEIVFSFFPPSPTQSFDHTGPLGVLSVDVPSPASLHVSLNTFFSSSYPFALLSSDLAPRASPVLSL